MCGRYGLSAPERLSGHEIGRLMVEGARGASGQLKLGLGGLRPRYNIAPSQPVPVVLVGEGRVEPAGSYPEGGLAAGARADGFVLVSEGSEGVAQGAEVAGDGRPRGREMVGDLAGRFGAVAEDTEDFSAGGIREGAEHQVVVRHGFDNM
jgi:hypothetical protein